MRLDDLQHVDVAALGDGDGDPRTEPTTLLLVGVDYSIFWALVVFLFNYIPNIGSLFAVLLPSRVVV